MIKKLSANVMGLQWNIDLTKCQETGQGGNLFVISGGSLYRTPPFNEFSGKLLNC